MNLPPTGTHASGDAFLLMRYEGAGGRREWIWNSRDGVTQMFIRSADDEAVELHHGNWHLDRYEPSYVPVIGSRIFVDLTEELARPAASEYVERYWDDAEIPMSAHPTFSALGRAATVEYFVKEWVSAWGGHAPHLIVVTPAVHAQCVARSASVEARR